MFFAASKSNRMVTFYNKTLNRLCSLIGLILKQLKSMLVALEGSLINCEVHALLGSGVYNLKLGPRPAKLLRGCAEDKSAVSTSPRVCLTILIWQFGGCWLMLSYTRAARLEVLENGTAHHFIVRNEVSNSFINICRSFPLVC